MNIKVIIVWLFAIVVVAGIGVFGWANQDLLVEQGTDIYTPSTQGGNNIYCAKDLGIASSSYTFELNEETNEIQKVIMTYNSKSSNLNAHEAAVAIRDAQINGVQTSLSGTVSSFMFMVTVDLATYDKATVEFMDQQFQTLGMVIDSITDYQTYITAINDSTSGADYSCNN